MDEKTRGQIVRFFIENLSGQKEKITFEEMELSETFNVIVKGCPSSFLYKLLQFKQERNLEFVILPHHCKGIKFCFATHWKDDEEHILTVISKSDLALLRFMAD